MMVVANSGILSTMTTTASAEITDKVDSPHSGLFKALHRMSEGNYTVKDAHAALGLIHTFSFHADGNPQVAITAGKGFFSGKYITIGALTTYKITSGKPASGTFYHWARYNSSGTISIVIGTSDGVVPALGIGYAPISLIRVQSTNTVAGDIACQLFTTSKTGNSLSIGYEASNIYAEAMNITASSGDVTFKNIVSDKDIIFNVSDGGVDTEVMRIDGSTSRVGIGTDTPLSTLHLTSGSGYIQIETNGSTGTIKSDFNLNLYADDTGGNSASYQNIKFYTAGANERMRIDNTGKVGIGTDTPATLLHVESADNDLARFKSTDDLATFTLQDNDTTAYFNAGGGSSGHLSIGGNAGTHTDNLNINVNTGNTGIGTNAPSAPLHVKYTGTGNGFILESTDAGASNAPDLVLYRNAGADPTANDELGHIIFRGLNNLNAGGVDSTANVDYAYIAAKITTETEDDEEGVLKFGIHTGVAGSSASTTLARLGKPYVVANATSVHAGWHTRPATAIIGNATYAPDVASSGTLVIFTHTGSKLTLPSVDNTTSVGVQFTVFNETGSAIESQIYVCSGNNTWIRIG